MSLEGDKNGNGRFLAPLDRARLVSEALSEAARRARFSSRSRRNTQGGFGARQGQTLMHYFTVASFWLIVVIPSVLSIAYFAYFASDQYVSEIKFTVAGTEPPILDGIGVITGIPSMSIIQDTQIVANHLHSRATVEMLEKRLDLRKLVSGESIDWLSRFDAKKPVEHLVRFWEKQVSVAILMPAGIVDVRVKAFSPEASRDIASALIEISESLINDMNERMNRDAVSLAEAELERASQRLSAARINLQKIRNTEGVLDAGFAAEGISKLITATKSALLQLQLEFRTHLRVVSENAPQMQALRARILATEKQIAEMEAQLTRRDSASGTALSSTLMRFSELELERQISEKLYAGAIGALELARINAERKKMYLNTFVTPSLAQEARYPRRLLSSFLSVLAVLLVWGALVGSIAMIRNHMA